jgi:hypothetical protein
LPIWFDAFVKNFHFELELMLMMNEWKYRELLHVFELNKFDQIQLPESIASLFLLDGPWFAVLACNQAGKQEGFLFRQERKPLKPPFPVKQ